MSFASAVDRGGDSGSRWSDVYIAAGARGVSVCGDFVAQIALVLALQARGAGGLAVAAVLLGGAVPVAVLAPLSGRLVDRLDSRLLICVSTLAQAVVCGCLAFVVGDERGTGGTGGAGTAGIAVLVTLVTLLGVGLAVTQPTLSALLPSMVTRGDLPRASAIGQTANMIGMLVAPALGGLLVGRFGVRVPLVVDAASYLVLAGAGLLIRTRRGAQGVREIGAHGAGAPGGAGERVARPDTNSTLAARPIGGAGWSLRRDTLLWTQFALHGAVLAAVSATGVIEVFFIRGTLHGSTTLYGLISAAWVAGMVPGAWLFARKRGSDGWLAVASLGQMGAITLVGLAACAAPRAEWLFPLWLLGGACNGGLSVAMNVQVGRRVPERSRGRAFAIFAAVANGANAIGYLLGGALLAVTSPRMVFAGTEAAGLLVVLAFALPLLRAARRDERECAPAHPAAAGNVQNRELSTAPQSRAHPVPELPADLLGSDALGRTSRS